MPDEQLYREVLLERFSNPVNQGTVTKPDLEARLVNNLCGDEILLQIKEKKGVITQARYSGNGCALSQVSASYLAENLEGKKLAAIAEIKEDDILKWIGVKVGPGRIKCVLLSFEVLKKALEKTAK